jgi:hypothetical protein
MTPEPSDDRSFPATPLNAVPTKPSEPQARLAPSDWRSYSANDADQQANEAEVDAVLKANWATISRQAAARAAGLATNHVAAQQVWEQRIERCNWLLAAAALLMIVHSSWAALNLRSLVHRSTAALAVVHATRNPASSDSRELGESLWFDDVRHSEPIEHPRSNPRSNSRSNNRSSSRSSLDPSSGFSTEPQRA